MLVEVDPREDGLPAPPTTAPPDAVRASIKAQVLAASLGRAAEPVKLGGRYRLIREIGRGGIGTVWEAELEPIGRKVAIKLLRAKRGADAAERLVREAVAASQIGHPHIVGVHDVGTDDRGAPYLVMDLLAGESLARVIERERSLPWADVQTIAEQVCAALAAAHEVGVVHRDVKPANVFVRRDANGRWHSTLLDFGLCKASDHGKALTVEGTLLGTPGYMAPEQIRGEPVDPRADVYAVACIVVEMLGGRPTFAGTRREDIMAAQLEGRHAPLPTTLTPTAREALRRALAVDPEQRPESAAELRKALVATSLAQTRPAFDSPPPRSRSAYAIGVVAIAAFGVGIALVQGSREEAAPQRPVPVEIVDERVVPPPPPASPRVVEEPPVVEEPVVVAPVVEPTKPTRRTRKRPPPDVEKAVAPPEPKPKRTLVDGIRDPFEND